MKKNISIILIILILLGTLVGCKDEKYTKYDYAFYGSFDTITQIVGYTKTKEEFTSYMEIMENRFMELHRLYDRFNNYEGINNIKTINDNAGLKPVKVEKEIIDLILFSMDLYEKTGNLTNIAMGSVTDIWGEYRDRAVNNPEDAELPPMELLEKAKEYTDMSKIIVNEEESTVYLEEKGMKLDVGAVAKGYATELVAREIEEKGFNSVLISAGGNIRGIGKPLDGFRDKWGVGIQNPDVSVFKDEGKTIELVFINDSSVVSSGDYQRYYVVDGEVQHHIIHPETLMPPHYYRQVTIVTPDSGMADFYSTAVYILPFEESKALVESMDDFEAMWVFPDGTIEMTEGMKKMAKSHGATGEKSK